MSILVKSTWDLVLRVTICYVVFYAAIYFVLALINGMSLQRMIFSGEFSGMAYSTPVIWLKFATELFARLSAAVVLSVLGVPKYRFARLSKGHLYTHLTDLLPLWFKPVLMIAAFTTIGMLIPQLSGHIFLWILIHVVMAAVMVSHLLHGSVEDQRLRIIEA
jgi:hypothetical protein